MEQCVQLVCSILYVCMSTWQIVICAFKSYFTQTKNPGWSFLLRWETHNYFSIYNREIHDLSISKFTILQTFRKG